MANKESENKVKLSAELIYGFTGTCLSGAFDEPAPTPVCHVEWWTMCCSPYKRVAISAPRGHAKSTSITKSYTLAAALFRDSDFILLVSDTWKQACLFLGELKRELTLNENVKSLFGIKGFIADREDDIIVQMDDGYQFRIMALGSEQKVRGLLWNGKRPNLIVGDDLENDEIVMNPERREKFKMWVNNALLPCMSKRGKVRFVGTILHMASFLESVMPRDRDNNSNVTRLRVTMKEPKNGWFSARYAADEQDSEIVLWNGKHDKASLREKFQFFKDQGNPEGYYQEYRNRPIDPTNSFFKKDDFIEFTDFDYDKEKKNGWEYAPVYLSCDLALTVKEKRDWCAFGIVSIDENGYVYLRHVLRDRMDSKDIIETIMRLQTRFKFSTMLVGKGAIEKSIGPFLNDELRRRGKFLHLETIPENQDKRLRAQPIRGRMRVGGVKFNKRANWWNEFEQEMLEFDRGTHDDQVDMMSLIGMYLDKLQDGPTIKEIEEMQYDDEFNRPDMVVDLGRSVMTGY